MSFHHVTSCLTNSLQASMPGIPNDAFRNIQAYIMENPNLFDLVKK
jgi:hypothetical protein